MTSNFFIPLASPLFILFLFFTEGNFGYGILAALFLGLIFGAIFYIPTVILTLILEAIIINPNATSKTVLLTFITEGIAAFFIIGYFMEFFSYERILLIGLFISISVPQILRWIWLITKGRMYTNDISITDSNILDDVDLNETYEH